MNPTMPQQQPQTPTMPQQNQSQFSAGHHTIYEKLRGVLMNLHAQGVPGMDQVLQALNKVHVNNLKQQPQLPNIQQLGQQAGQAMGNYAQRFQDVNFQPRSFNPPQGMY